MDLSELDVEVAENIAVQEIVEKVEIMESVEIVNKTETEEVAETLTDAKKISGRIGLSESDYWQEQMASAIERNDQVDYESAKSMYSVAKAAEEANKIDY